MTSRSNGKDRSHFVVGTRCAVAIGLFSAIGLGVTSQARAETWSNGALCAFNIAGIPHAWAFGSRGLEVVWSNDQGSSWNRMALGVGTSYTNQIACASDGNSQGLVVIRTSDGNVRSWDRASGWQPSNAFVDLNHSGSGMKLIKVNDQGKTKFVLFTGTASQLTMSVYDDTANPKWGPMTWLTLPNGSWLEGQADLAAYSINIGPGASDASVAVWVVDKNGVLRRNEGKLTGPRTWSTPISPGSGKTFSNAAGYGPTAFAYYASPVGHPGDYIETDYYRRVALPTTETSTGQIYLMSCLASSSTTFQCTQIAGMRRFPASGPARGCWTGGLPCINSMTIVALSLEGNQLKRWYAGPTDGTANPPSGWTDEQFGSVSNVAFSPLVGSDYGVAFFFWGRNANTLMYTNLDWSPFKTNFRFVGDP